MKKENIENVIRQCIGEEYDVPVSPALIARCAQQIIDPDDVSPPLVGYCTNLYLREQARRILARTYDPVTTEEQPDMFGGLQDMYPAHRTEGDKQVKVYVPRMQLTYEERLFNIERLEREVASKIKHIDALRAETEKLLQDGYFQDQLEG